jgi:hypothetical protein
VTAKKKIEVGADPKKMAVLGGLVLLAGYLFYSNMSSTPSTPPPSSPKPGGPAASLQRAVDTEVAPPPKRAANRKGDRGASSDFKPTLKRDPDHPQDPASIDPTLRLDLLDKLAKVKVDRVDRSLFDFSQGPVAKTDIPKLPEPKIVVKKRMIGPEPPPPPPPPYQPPPPPPITLKFYGGAYPGGGGVKRVFTMEGEDVFTLAEGDVLKRRYKIIRINATSVVVEDLDHKHQQTINIAQLPKSE